MRTAIFDQALQAALDRYGLPIAPAQLAQLRTHYEAMIETNKVMNLTRITDPVEAAVKHYADSLAVLLWCRDRNIECRTVLDIGTGAGFPALPLAVMRPDWQVTAIDGTAKKVNFLRGVIADLKLANLCVEHAHSTHWQPNRTFDLVVFRALARLDKVIRESHSYLKPRGRFVAYKTASVGQTELATAADAAASLCLAHGEDYAYELIAGDETIPRKLCIYGESRGSSKDHERGGATRH